MASAIPAPERELRQLVTCNRSDFEAFSALKLIDPREPAEP